MTYCLPTTISSDIINKLHNNYNTHSQSISYNIVNGYYIIAMINLMYNIALPILYQYVFLYDTLTIK